MSTAGVGIVTQISDISWPKRLSRQWRGGRTLPPAKGLRWPLGEKQDRRPNQRHQWLHPKTRLVLLRTFWLPGVGSPPRDRLRPLRNPNSWLLGFDVRRLTKVRLLGVFLAGCPLGRFSAWTLGERPRGGRRETRRRVARLFKLQTNTLWSPERGAWRLGPGAESLRPGITSKSHRM